MQTKKRENILVSMLLNIVIPVMLLTKYNDKFSLTPVQLLLVALVFPLGYGIYDFVNRSKFNWISAIGVFSVVYTGIIGIMQLPPQWIAVKEASIPFIIGVSVIVSVFIGKSLITKMLFNDEFFNVDLLHQKIDEYNAHDSFNKYLKKMSILLSLTFFFSAALNYILARIIVVSQPGTVEFNQELGKLTALSFPVIAVPSMIFLMIIMFLVFRQIKKLTGLTLEQIVVDRKKIN